MLHFAHRHIYLCNLTGSSSILILPLYLFPQNQTPELQIDHEFICQPSASCAAQSLALTPENRWETHAQVIDGCVWHPTVDTIRLGHISCFVLLKKALHNSEHDGNWSPPSIKWGSYTCSSGCTSSTDNSCQRSAFRVSQAGAPACKGQY